MTPPIPAHVVLAWADDAGIYLELPFASSHTRVTFHPTPEGLRRALSFLQAHKPKPPSRVIHGNAKADAQAILRKIGLRNVA